MIVAFLPFDDKTIKEFAIKLAAFFFLKMKVQLRIFLAFTFATRLMRMEIFNFL